MLRNASSTCNLKMSRKNRADQSDYFKLPHSESKVREISQPVKIAQLLGCSGQSSQKNSAIKISQPERITPYLKKTTTEKKNKIIIINRLYNSEKNVRRNLKFTETPTITKKTKKIVKESTSDSHNDPKANKRSSCSSTGNNRKSFLLPPNTIKDMHVKNRFKHSKSMLPHINHMRNITATSTSKYLRISEVSESDSPLIDSTNVLVNSVLHEKNNKTSVIQHTSLQTFNANQSGINILHSSSSDLTDMSNAVEKEAAEHFNFDEVSIKVYGNRKNNSKIINNEPQLSSMHNTTEMSTTELCNKNYSDSRANTACTLPGADEIKKLHSIKNFEISPPKKCVFMTTNDCKGDLYASLDQVVKTISESNVNLQCDANEKYEYLTINKRELTNLSFMLKNIIHRLEEDVSYLKLTLTSITNLLPANATDTINDDNRTKNKQEMTDNLNDTIEIVSNMNAKSVPCITVTSTINTEDDKHFKDTSKETREIPNLDLSKFSKTDVPNARKDNFDIQSSRQIDSVADNKENATPQIDVKCSEPKSETRRRSARLIVKALRNSITTNDSFVNLENELNITNANSNATIVSHKDYHTPVSNKCRDKKAGRPWREYMALKSRMSCLLTPNTKRFDSSGSKSNVHLETGGASLSNKIYEEFHNLYTDSPDVQ